jgi:hypothetical protein
MLSEEKRESADVAPSMNPEERPNLQDYKGKESTNATTNPVRHKQFRQALKGFSTRTLSIRTKQLEKSGKLERQRYNEIPPRVEYTLTMKGQKLVESVVSMPLSIIFTHLRSALLHVY